ncbi:MAG: hypothetical protein WCO57_07180 [Verrucomicrobiota bacterium]
MCATNDYHAIKTADVSDLPSEIGETSCNRYNTVINGLKQARQSAGLRDDEMVYEEDVRSILKSCEFGCTVHSTVFDTQDATDLPWS